MKRALITGITGQDGSYLARFLLAKGYQVHGVVRRSSTFGTERLTDIYEDPHQSGVRLVLHYGDMSDASSLRHLLANADPEEVYNLAAQSHVMVSFHLPEYTADVNATGTLRLLQAIRDRADQTGQSDSLLPGRVVGNVRFHGASAKRAKLVPAPQPLRRQ